MSDVNCKLLTIVTEALLESELTGRLLELGASGFTVTDARGSGHRGVRSSEWKAGGNIRIEVLCREEIADKITGVMQAEYYENFAMILYVSDVLVLRPEKFA